MARNILITGASGLVGTALTKLLQEKGHHVSILTRNRNKTKVKAFEWDIKSGYVQAGALDGIDTIIHLAGASIAGKRWTDKRMREILESRTSSTALLYTTLASQPHSVKTFVSSSAVGYYGFGDASKKFTEQDPPGNDFLADVTRKWEAETDKLSELGIRVAKIRTGIVFSDCGGALEQMSRPVRWGIGAPIGSGKQIISWIHITDLCSLFTYVIENEATVGAFNAVSPHPVTNEALTQAIGRVLGRPLWLPNIPAFILRMALGQVSEYLLKGSDVSPNKIMQAGYTFKYPGINEALIDLLRK